MARENRKRRGTGNKTISIIVDGETEVWYLQMLRDTEKLGQSLNIKPELPTKQGLQKQFQTVCEKAKIYNQVIWLMDFDTVIKESKESPSKQKKFDEVKQYFHQAQQLGNVTILVNTPCLEFWFLLHDKTTGKYYEKCKPVESLLKTSNILPKYKKTEEYFKNNKLNIYQRLKPYQKQANNNAMQLGDFNIQQPETAKAETYKIFQYLGIHI